MKWLTDDDGGIPEAVVGEPTPWCLFGRGTSIPELFPFSFGLLGILRTKIMDEKFAYSDTSDLHFSLVSVPKFTTFKLFWVFCCTTTITSAIEKCSVR